MTPGINLPADTRIAPESAAELGVHWVRVVLLTSVDLTDWMHACHAQGLSVLGVIARESLVRPRSR